MKKVFILTLVLMLTLVGCGESTTQEATQDAVVADAPAVAETEEPVEEEPVEEVVIKEETTEVEEFEEVVEEVEEHPASVGIGDTFVVGDAEVTVKSAEIVESGEYGKTLKVVFDWVNKSDDTTSPMIQLLVSAFQNGTGIERVFDYEVINSDNESKEARPDGTVPDIEIGFQISDDSPVEIDFEEYVSFDDTATTITIDPSSL